MTGYVAFFTICFWVAFTFFILAFLRGGKG